MKFKRTERRERVGETLTSQTLDGTKLTLTTLAVTLNEQQNNDNAVCQEK